MLRNFIRVLGVALLLDGILLGITIPLSKVVIGIALPASIPTTPLLGTYGMVIFVILAALMLFFLWTCENLYSHWFDFWDLLVTMIILMLCIVFWEQIIRFVEQMGLQTSF
jgi:sterol desaturase/sphingolipid hydroxylase (fatty acid hydroxylase superfamily)